MSPPGLGSKPGKATRGTPEARLEQPFERAVRMLRRPLIDISAASSMACWFREPWFPSSGG